MFILNDLKIMLSKIELIPVVLCIVLWLRAQNLGGPQPRVEQSTTYMV
jgi:hypothetical protein